MPRKSQSQQRIADQIKAYIKRRQKTGHGIKVHVNEFRRPYDLQEEMTGNEQLDQVVAEYIVVKLVALLQSAFRGVFRIVVDSMDAKGDAVPDFDLKLSMPMVQELKNRNFSLGDFVSFSLPINSYQEMMGSFEQVSGESFTRILQRHLK